MKKKIITLFLILLFILTALLGGCNLKTNADTTQAAQEQADSQLPDLGKFVVVVPTSDSKDYSAGNEVVKQKIISSIATDKGVKIDFDIIELPADNFTNELNNLLVASTNIDAIVIDADMLSTYASLGSLIKPIDELIAASGTNLYNAIDSTYWDECTYDGALYGVPSMPYPEQSVMIARSDVLYMFTAEPITEFTQLFALCKFYKSIGYEYPLAATWDQLIDMFALSFPISPEPYTYDVKYKSFLMREQESIYTKYFLEEMKRLYDNGYVNPSLFTATDAQMKEEFLSGRSAIYVGEYGSLLSDRTTLKSIFPTAEMTLIAPLSLRERPPYLSCEEKVDNILVFTQSGEHSEALMAYLDWAYTSQLNHTMTELGAFGDQIMYNPVQNEYQYIGDYSLDNIPYNGLYTLGLSTDVTYTKPTYVEYTNEIMAINKLQKEVESYLSDTEYVFSVTVPLNDNAQAALDQYTWIMRSAAAQYLEGTIDIDEYAAFDRECRSSGLLDTLAQEIGVPYMYKIGVLK